MFRIQEFFESPHEHIKGKVFSVEDFLATYYAPGHEIDYFAYWGGFNVPKDVVDDFFNRYGDALTLREQALKHVWRSSDYQYLIAVDVDDADNALEHELAHARYAIDEQYRNECADIVCNMSSQLRAKLCFE